MTRDSAAVALAKRYAALIEGAEATARELGAVDAEDETTAQTVARLKARVEAQAVASDLGPKLLAVLAALSMTPQARAGTTKGQTPGAGTPAADALARLRAERSSTRAH